MAPLVPATTSWAVRRKEQDDEYKLQKMHENEHNDIIQYLLPPKVLLGLIFFSDPAKI